MDALLDYLDDIEELLEKSKGFPLTGKISVDKDKLVDIVNEIRLSLPDDMRIAQRILGDHDKILEDAKHRAANILDDAKAEAKALTNSHEIFRRASEQAADHMEETKRSAREIRLNAMDYADEILEKAENQIRQTMDNMEQQHRRVMEYYEGIMDIIYENRQQLRGR
ncbi:MAG: hypothetical protein FWC73_03485 [Defluviitaleaceae bacterium]|nr:hypothetical protein [Defluviitaleaceae bacterium]